MERRFGKVHNCELGACCPLHRASNSTTRGMRHIVVSQVGAAAGEEYSEEEGDSRFCYNHATCNILVDISKSHV